MKNMIVNKLSEGTVHRIPKDLQLALNKNDIALKTWEDITPLARNEWICWVVSVKQQKTRDEHVTRAIEQLAKGKRRPCCWIGCVHRTDKSISQSVKGILSKATKV